jgi:2-methylcitrate dehydratase PrpD
MDPAYDLAKNFVKVGYADLTSDAVEVTKKEIIDTLGVTLAASSRPEVKKYVKMFKDFGGRKDSSIIAHGIKLPVAHAAQVNSAMAWCLDFDAVIDNGPVHHCVVNIPSCFAVSEYKGEVSGKDFITAIALGDDLIARLIYATIYEEKGRHQAGWNFACLYGSIVSAGITGKILGFGEDKMVSALGIGYEHSSGTLQAINDGAINKAADFAVGNGILGALLVKRGITATKNWVEGEFGLYNLYHRGGYDKEALLKDLGEVLHGVDLSIKPYPCCRGLHTYIDATLALVNEHDIKPEQVQEITASGSRLGYSLSAPKELKCNPRNPTASQFSVPWAMAIAIVRRGVSIKDFTTEAIRDANVLRICNKINPEMDPALDAIGPHSVRVKIMTNEGIYTKEVNEPIGSPQNPMTFEQCVNKFRDCASYSIKPLPEETISKIIESVEELEKMEDITEIIKMVS